MFGSSVLVGAGNSLSARRGGELSIKSGSGPVGGDSDKGGDVSVAGGSSGSTVSGDVHIASQHGKESANIKMTSGTSSYII